MLGCVFHKGMLGFQTASGNRVFCKVKRLCRKRSTVVQLIMRDRSPSSCLWKWYSRKVSKETSYLVKQRKLVMVSAIECHSAVDHHFWCRSPLTSCGKALSSQHTHATLQQVAGRCLVSFLRGWNTVCVQMLSPKLSSYRWKNNTFAQLGLPAGSEAWQRNLTHLHGSLYRWCFHNYP